MVLKNVDSEAVQVLHVALEPGMGQSGKMNEEKKLDVSEESSSRSSEGFIPKRLWVLHGTIMFGREFCYAMETALVTPVLLQIGLPEQYYSLTWFLSPILGLILSPLIGSASDQCTLKWGRRRPFILALGVGVLMGVALFLNGSVVGLAVGDFPGNQPIGIVLTVLGVVVLDFCLDALDGPIRSYLLDVADVEEQDMALNIHAFAAGLGGAMGYMFGGMDWTNTFLGHAFKAQEQVLFFFASIVFIISVALHLFSIKEHPYDPRRQKSHDGEESESSSSVELNRGLSCPRPGPRLDLISEEGDFQFYDDDQSEREIQMDFLNVRSKSDSALAVPDTTIKLDLDLDLDGYFLHNVENFRSEMPFKNCHDGACQASQSSVLHLEVDPNNKDGFFASTKVIAGDLAGNGNPASLTVAPTNQQHRSCLRHSNVAVRRRHPSFFRQPSFTFTYHGRMGFQRPRRRPIESSRSLNDLDALAKHQARRRMQHSGSTSTETEDDGSEDGGQGGTTVKLMWLSMLKMPPHLWRLCVCHLLTWFSIISQAVFYTDFMGQVIFEGDPMAATNTTDLQNYHKGVQMGCWGLVVYAFTSAICSAVLQKYLDNYDLSIKIIYMLGTFGFAVGTAVMAIFPNIYVAMVMISSMGIVSMSISYCPYALLGQYHEIKEYILHSPGKSRRGFGIDCAILTCQVYISQILVASALGAVVKAVGTVRVIPMVASGGSFLGFITAALLVIYPDTPEEEDDDEEERSPSTASAS
ncbi:solute carrier family 45 member 4 [Trichomycterus rosablanca]|uniref:solute carrier family 45 member 4 n=1 Tax=Trichomycterus rosablanca TaxID=2290929 RepID=UPI002F359373